MNAFPRVLQAISGAVFNPLSFIAIVIAICAWAICLIKIKRYDELSKQTDRVLKTIEGMQPKEKADALRRNIKQLTGEVLPENIEPKEYIEFHRNRLIFFAFVVLVALVLCIVGIVAVAYTNTKIGGDAHKIEVDNYLKQIKEQNVQITKHQDEYKFALIKVVDMADKTQDVSRAVPSGETVSLAKTTLLLVKELATKTDINKLSKFDQVSLKIAQGNAENVTLAIDIRRDLLRKAPDSIPLRMDLAASLQNRAIGYAQIVDLNNPKPKDRDIIELAMTDATESVNIQEKVDKNSQECKTAKRMQSVIVNIQKKLTGNDN